MSVLAPPRPQHSPRAPRPTNKLRSGLLWLAGAGAGVVVLVMLAVVLLAGAGSPPCPTAGQPVTTPPAGGPLAPGTYARPLRLTPGKSYEVGATEYGGEFGASGAFLPAHPDTFAELSVDSVNPYPNFRFADGNSLDQLPYMTGLIVSHAGRKLVLYKRDVGYGQGPGQLTPNGQPYRIDVYDQSAAPYLGVSKNPVEIELAPATGTGNILGQTPTPQSGAPSAGELAQCAGLPATATLQLTVGQRAQILPNGDASAPAGAPRAVKLAIAAANQIHTKPYSVYPDGHAVHYGPLSQAWPAYDCSGSASFVLYRAGLHSVNADVSGTLEQWGQPGPGKWITVYANSAHTWVVIAGLAFDTADYGGPNIPAGSGPRWRSDPTANLQDGASYVVRHPGGL